MSYDQMVQNDARERLMISMIELSLLDFNEFMKIMIILNATFHQ